MSTSYEKYYEITLLDDLHNYFPDILYSDRFNDNPLVTYVQEQTRHLFNLYSSARRRHEITHTNPSSSRSASSYQSAQSSERRTHSSRVIQLPGRPIPNRTVNSEQVHLMFTMDDEQPPPVVNEFDTLTSVISILNSLNSVLPLQRQTSFMDPVTVVPTQQEIQTATTLIELSTSTEVCAICQENLVSDSSQIRRINHCQHMFHNNCILQWFRRNVRCPTCRHDIRVD